MNNFSLGCDPEMFLADAAGGLISSIGLIGGTKEAPAPLPIGDGFAVQEDNVAVEFNIPPSSSAEEYSENIQKVISFLNERVKEAYGLGLCNISAASFPQEQLEDPRALVFGCDPDFNAWTGKRNPKPRAKDANLRSCGGHIHVGYKFQDKEEAKKLIRIMDLTHGVPSVLMDAAGDKRRELYGARGAYRIKPYGVEYRTLSNFWIFNEGTRKWAFTQTARALESLHTLDVDSEDALIYDAINNNNKDVAKYLVDKYSLEVVNA